MLQPARTPSASEEGADPLWSRLVQRPRTWYGRLLRTLVVAPALVLITLWVRLMLGFTPGDLPMDEVLMLPIAAAAWQGGLPAGVVASLVAAVGSDRALLQPGTTFHVHAESAIRHGVLVAVVGTLLSALVDRLVRARLELLDHDGALRSSEERFRLLAQHAPTAIAMFDREMRYLVVSRRFLSDYGMENRPVVGRSHYEVFPEIPERWREIHRRCLAGETASSEEDAFVRADGTEEWVRWEILPWRDARGEIGGVVLFSETITERKRMQDERDRLLRVATAEKERLAVTLGSIGDAVIATDAQGRVTLLNPMAESLTGWTTAEAEGRPLDDVFHIVNESTLERMDSPVQRVLRDGKTVALANHTALLRRDGSSRPIADSAAPIRDHTGELVGVVLVFRDQTREREAERALRTSESRYRGIFEQASVGVMQADAATGRVIAVNPKLCEMLGYSREEFGTLGWADITFPDEVQRDQQGIDRMWRTGEPHQRQKRYRRKDGSVMWASVSVSPVAGSSPPMQIAVVLDITERMEAEARIHSQRDQLARIAASVPGCIYVLERRADGSVHVPFATAAVESLFGIAQSQVADGIDLLLANVHQEDVERVRARLDDAIRSPAQWHDSFRYRHPTRGVRWIEGWSIPAHVDGGSVQWHGFVTDVTEMRTAEEAQLLSQVRFRALFEYAGVGMAEIDAETKKFLSTNEKFREFTGYSDEEIRERTWEDITHPDELEADRAYVSKVGKDARPLTREKRYVRKDGSTAWGALTITPLWRPGTAPTTLVAVIQDVTSRKAAEQALEHSAQRFRALIEHASDIVVVLDDQYRVTFWGPSAEDHLGYASAEVMGRTLEFLVSEHERMRVWDVIGAVKSGGSARVTTQVTTRNGVVRTMELNVRNLLEDPAVRGMVANARDITEQQRLTEQFHQAQKLESIGRLAGGVAHDFNNLLTVILSCSDTLGAGLRDASEDSREDLEQIRASAERAAALTRQLLAFARKQVVEPVPLDLNELVRGTQKLLGRLLGEDVRLDVRLGPGLWTLHADPGQLEQVIVNLAVNARDAMPGGGTLTIETSNVVGAETDGDGTEWIKLVVRDTGHGMTPEVRAHLFEPFFTTKPQGKGTGLGLATVYGIVTQAGGQVHVESEPGRGATFELVFPRSHRPREVVAGMSAQPAGGTETILLVEDDAQVRSILGRALRGVGYRVHVAPSGSEALEMLRQYEGPLHLVVTDVVMPGVDGKTLVDEVLRIRNPPPRVLFISGYTDDIISHHGILHAGVELLVKPFRPPVLLKRVREILDRG